MAQFLALVRLSNRRLGSLKGVRLARLYAVSLAFSYLLLAAILSSANPGRLGQIIDEALSFASWLVCGIAVLGVVRAPRGFATSLRELGHLRGYASSQVRRAYWLSLALRIATDLWITVAPALVVVALFSETPSLGQRFGWPLFALVYGASLGLAIAALLLLAQRASPRYALLLFVALLVTPDLLALFTPLPGLGLPALCGRALDWAFDSTSAKLLASLGAQVET